MKAEASKSNEGIPNKRNEEYCVMSILEAISDSPGCQVDEK